MYKRQALLGGDANCAAYIAAYGGAPATPAQPAAQAEAMSLHDAVLRGLRQPALEAAKRELAQKDPLAVIESGLIDVYKRQALTYTHSMYAAEEIVGDTIVALLEAEAEFKNEGACAVYMRTIVRHKAVSMFRKKYTVEPQDDESIEREFIERNQMERPYNCLLYTSLDFRWS